MQPTYWVRRVWHPEEEEDAMRAYNMKNNKLGVRAEHTFLTANTRDWFHMLLPCTFLCVVVWVGFQTSIAFCTADTNCPPYELSQG